MLSPTTRLSLSLTDQHQNCAEPSDDDDTSYRQTMIQHHSLASTQLRLFGAILVKGSIGGRENWRALSHATLKNGHHKDTSE